MAACVQWTRPPRHVDESSMVDTAHATGHSEDVVASTAHITCSGTKICRHMHNSEKKISPCGEWIKLQKNMKFKMYVKWRRLQVVLQFFGGYPAMGDQPLLLEWHGSAPVSRSVWKFVEGFLEGISRQWCSRNKNITGTLGRKPATGGKNFWTCTLLQVSFGAFLVNWNRFYFSDFLVNILLFQTERHKYEINSLFLPKNHYLSHATTTDVYA